MSETTLGLLTWLIPAGPLVAFFLIMLFFRKNHQLSFLTAWTGIGVALVFSWLVVSHVLGIYWQDYQNGTYNLDHQPTVIQSSIAWLPIGDYYANPPGASFEGSGANTAVQGTGGLPAYRGQWFAIGVAVDPLNSIMLIMVPFTVLMIFIYSVGYHNYGKPLGTKLGVPNHEKEEPLFGRFFGMMSLFAAGMLILVVGDSLLLLFIGWEIMGFCSYSLIGFWYARTYDDPRKIPPRYASIKAFMTTRVADVVMLLGIVYYYRVFGTLSFSETMLNSEALIAAVNNPYVGGIGLSIMALLLFVGTDGKSAQWPLHTWLPDAMEGPTPVSAVIHAAAMVSAGIFLLLRIFPLIAIGLEANPAVGLIIGGIGAFTALMAATMALAQTDVKGVLAFSTISQLGFMVAALAVGGVIAASFHLITHAFFKALLFMGSGSIIHGMEYGAEKVHDHHTDPQNMYNMGGLAKKMPITFVTFVIGGLALSGFPLVTAGFWSKDEIFVEAWFVGSNDGNPLGYIIFGMLSVAAFLTAFYTMRQIALTFLGEPRTALAEHAHESSGYMTLPLVLLSIPAIAAGWFGIPDNFLNTSGIFYNHFHHFVGAAYHETIADLYAADLVAHKIATIPWSWVPLSASIFVALGGLALGWLVYGRNPLAKGGTDPLVNFLGEPLFNFLHNRWYWDQLYQRVFIQPAVYISEVVVPVWMDKGIIDGLLHLMARVTFAIGGYSARFEVAVFGDGIDWLKDRFLDVAREFRTLQSGKVQEYALLSTILVSVFAIFMLVINSM